MPMAPMGMDRRSRVLSVDSWAMSGGGSSDGTGFGPEGEGGYFPPQGGFPQQQGGGLRASRSAVNLGYASPPPGVMPEFVGQQQSPGQQYGMVRNSSYGGGFPGGGFPGGGGGYGGFAPGPSGLGPGSESSASLATATVTGGAAVAPGQGPSTFDDILKGMDGKGKKKKKFLF